jgi:membrane protein implicated in regulation of membrane protease activity
MTGAFRNYLMAQLPGWGLAAFVVWALHGLVGLRLWLAFLLLAVWVVKDLVLFPVMRRFYEPQPAARRIVGETGTAITAISPDGLVRIRAELWQARADEQIAAGTPVRVLDIEGLTLLVTGRQ